MYIYLDELTFCMESFTEITYFNKLSGEYVHINDLNSEIDQNILLIPKVKNTNILIEYINQLNDKSIRSHLLRQKESKYFIEIFHKVINDNGLYNDFIIFDSEVVKSKAIEWCEQNDLICITKRRNNRYINW